MLTPDSHIDVRFVLQRTKIRAHIHAFNANRKTFNASHRVAISKKMKALYWRGHKGKRLVFRFHYIVLKYTILIVIAFGSYRIAPSVHMDVREPRQRHHEEWRRTTEIQVIKRQRPHQLQLSILHGGYTQNAIHTLLFIHVVTVKHSTQSNIDDYSGVRCTGIASMRVFHSCAHLCECADCMLREHGSFARSWAPMIVCDENGSIKFPESHVCVRARISLCVCL